MARFEKPFPTPPPVVDVPLKLVENPPDPFASTANARAGKFDEVELLLTEIPPPKLRAFFRTAEDMESAAKAP
jgi:hypothetical protein